MNMLKQLDSEARPLVVALVLAIAVSAALFLNHLLDIGWNRLPGLADVNHVTGSGRSRSYKVRRRVRSLEEGTLARRSSVSEGMVCR